MLQPERALGQTAEQAAIALALTHQLNRHRLLLW